MSNNVKTALENIDFLERYKQIALQYSTDDDSEKLDKSVVLNLIKEAGYNNAKYISKDKFYEIENFETNFISNNIRIGITAYTRFNEIDFVLSISTEESAIESGPFGVICQKLGNREFVRRPCFRNLKELKSIIDACLQIYDDLKNELIVLSQRQVN